MMAEFSPRMQDHLKTTGGDDVPKRPAAGSLARGLLVRASSLALRIVPPRSFVIEGLIPDQQVTLLAGDGGDGKTTAVIHIAVCVAAGRSWLGMETASGPVVILSAEDDIDEFHRRLDKICAYEQLDLGSLHDLIILPLAGRDALLATADSEKGPMKTTVLWDEIRATVSSIRPKLLVLDTLADVFGGNEINRGHARSFIGILRGLAIEFNLAVLLISHPSLTGISSGAGTSGSTAWSNSVRSRLYLERASPRGGGDPDPDARTLTVKKANYGPTGLTIRLRWRDGVFACDDGVISVEREAILVAKASAADDIFLRILRQFNGQGRTVSPAPSTNYAPKLFEQHPDATGFKKRAFAPAMERLLGAGAIHIVVRGPPSKPRKELVAGPPPRSDLLELPPTNALPTPI